MLDDDSPPSLSNPLEGLVGYHLRRAANAMLVDLARRIEPLGLTLTEMSVVQLIAANPGIRQSEIGKALAIKRANMAPIIAALESRGHVSRVALDGRSQGLNLTDSGEAVVRRLMLDDDLETSANVLDAQTAFLHRLQTENDALHLGAATWWA